MDTTKQRPTRAGAAWLRQTEADLDAHMNETAGNVIEDIERAERDAEFVAAFCHSGFGHEEIDYIEGEGPHLPAFAQCRACSTVLR